MGTYIWQKLKDSNLWLVSCKIVDFSARKIQCSKLSWIPIQHSIKTWLNFFFRNIIITIGTIGNMNPWGKCESRKVKVISLPINKSWKSSPYNGESSKFPKSWTFEIQNLKQAVCLQNNNNYGTCIMKVDQIIFYNLLNSAFWGGLVSLKILNSGIILKISTHEYSIQSNKCTYSS